MLWPQPTRTAMSTAQHSSRPCAHGTDPSSTYSTVDGCGCGRPQLIWLQALRGRGWRLELRRLVVAGASWGGITRDGNVPRLAFAAELSEKLIGRRGAHFVEAEGAQAPAAKWQQKLADEMIRARRRAAS